MPGVELHWNNQKTRRGRGENHRLVEGCSRLEVVVATRELSCLLGVFFFLGARRASSLYIYIIYSE